MARVMLVQPWNHEDEGIKNHDLSHEWRNGPYSLVLLGTILNKNGHEAIVADLSRDLLACNGNTQKCVSGLHDKISEFKPDIVGFGFFSFHKQTASSIVNGARKYCKSVGMNPMFIAGGIHATIEPQETKELGFDYAFKGVADTGILRLANGTNPILIEGVQDKTLGEETVNLDELPFPDWSLCDYKFYLTPSFSRMRIRTTSSLDMIMGRGCAFRCSFCAYNALSNVRFYSTGYLVEQMKYMKRSFGANGIYFTDSSMGNNRKLLRELCEAMIRADLGMEWYANIRVDQVDEDLLKLMWRAGCRLLLYGFESGSQRVLDLMNKKVKVEDNYRIAKLHHKLDFPFNASFIIGYPSETVSDAKETIKLIRASKPTSIGMREYDLLPGSPDYMARKEPSKLPRSLILRMMWEGHVKPLGLSDKVRLGMRVISRMKVAA